jgi:hypothetical protein
MSDSRKTRSLANLIITAGVPLLAAIAMAATLRLHYPLRLRWAILIIVGETALLLSGFTWPETAAAIRMAVGRQASAATSPRDAYFWEATARNAIHLGVLGTLIGFVTHIGSNGEGQAQFLFALGSSLLSTVYGLVLAAILCAPAVRSLWTSGTDLASKTAGIIEAPYAAQVNVLSREHAPGHLLTVALILWVLFSPTATGPVAPLDWFIHWPAWLLVFGGGLGLALMFGRSSAAGSLVFGFAGAGLVGSLLGMAQALQGFSQGSIGAVAQGIIFGISSSFAAHFGLLAAGFPLQDRSNFRRGIALSRVVWYGFPILTLLLIALATVLAMIPIKIAN